MRDVFKGSTQWTQTLFFTKHYVILEVFSRYKNGKVYNIYYTVYNKNGDFITNEYNTTIDSVLKKYL